MYNNSNHIVTYRKIQEESLRTFIFTFSETYDTLRYAEMFDFK